MGANHFTQRTITQRDRETIFTRCQDSLAQKVAQRIDQHILLRHLLRLEGIVAANSTIFWFRKGVRASRDCHMPNRAVFLRSSSGSWATISVITMRSNGLTRTLSLLMGSYDLTQSLPTPTTMPHILPVGSNCYRESGTREVRNQSFRPNPSKPRISMTSRHGRNNGISTTPKRAFMGDSV
jgi:hypothetical protein